jgi:hypothetical protein
MIKIIILLILAINITILNAQNCELQKSSQNEQDLLKRLEPLYKKK